MHYRCPILSINEIMVEIEYLWCKKDLKKEIDLCLEPILWIWQAEH